MSAYGAIGRPNSGSLSPLPATLWTNATGIDNPGGIVVHHLTLQRAQKCPGLLDYLHEVFEKVVEDGLTYPQEGEMNKETFLAYFFSADVFLGISLADPQDLVDGALAPVAELNSDNWRESVAGFYYVKPNYPGRSSHICNAGFVVPPNMQGRRYGKLLGKSYLHYAPKLGYQASVFNLVYVKNIASVRIWESLGFTKAGIIPSAGRLKRKDGNGEEFIDAFVFYKRFSEGLSVD
ncbi:acyl-CoA N-acyltransferase [Coprinopsis marcescibilis]|uniref:Acyl-CoA N-acyltransferase n=1 Tax=Coprinopsis marcescibilis TaxID=230819 RepID=A0A5C3KSC9_COPMA|nr:acyl-CoA N-acyltransferase [Coprinopsis marcescibilis]